MAIEFVDRKSFTITAVGKSIRKFNGKDSAMTRDVKCEFPNIEVRNDGAGLYVCQYRISKTVAVRLAIGCGMGDAVTNALTAIKMNGYDAKTLHRKALAAKGSKPAPAPTSVIRTAMQALQ